MINFKENGFLDSCLTDQDKVFECSQQSLPEKYSAYDYIIRDAKDQGDSYKCVAYTLSYILELQNSLNDKLIQVDINDLYSKRKNHKQNGMSIKEALNAIRHDGYKHNQGTSKINYYAKIGSIQAMKSSLIANGPFIMALPVCNTMNPEFWKGGEKLGGHAITCIGYNKDGFILINSWGESFGDGGKVILPYDDFKYIMEAWTIIL